MARRNPNLPAEVRDSACSSCGGLVVVPNGARLRAERMAEGVSLRAVAKALGYSPAYVSDVERNQRRFTWEGVSRYRAALREARR